MFLQPGEIVKHFNVVIELIDNKEILDLEVHADVLGKDSYCFIYTNLLLQHILIIDLNQSLFCYYVGLGYQHLTFLYICILCVYL